MGVGGNTTPRPLYLQERDPEHIVWEAGWTPGPENLVPTGIFFSIAR